MQVIDAIILAVLEGFSEFLPISSTGHLILASRLLELSQTGFVKSFEIFIQLGAIAAVAVLYWRRFLHKEFIAKVLVAFLPTGVIGFFLYPIVKGYFLGNQTIVLWALFLGGVLLIFFELFFAKKMEVSPSLSISYRNAFLIGVCQSLAIVPGVSRSAATIVGGLFLGLERKTIVEFSFLLAVPTILAASGFDLIKTAGSFHSDEFLVLLCGFAVSFFVALLAMRFLLAFIRRHTFIPFGVYRIALAVLFWWFIVA